MRKMVTLIELVFACNKLLLRCKNVWVIAGAALGILYSTTIILQTEKLMNYIQENNYFEITT